jgi:hypothetical protein
LYSLIMRRDTLEAAWEAVRRNHGVPGIEGRVSRAPHRFLSYSTGSYVLNNRKHDPRIDTKQEKRRSSSERVTFLQNQRNPRESFTILLISLCASPSEVVYALIGRRSARVWRRN